MNIHKKTKLTPYHRQEIWRLYHFRTFNVIDDFNREALGINTATNLPTDSITIYLDKLTEYHGYPLRIHVDNGAEFTRNTFTNYAKIHIRL